MTKPIRIAFSGSGFKIPAHIGALHAIVDAGYAPIEVAGTSGGSIVAALLACGMPLDQMTELAMTQDWTAMMSFELGSLMHSAICSGDNLHAWLDQHTSGKSFKDCKTALTIVASNMATVQTFTFSSDITPDAPVALAARASASIPFIYERVYYGDAILTDGGVVNNIPVDRLVVDDVPRIGIQLVSNDTPIKPSDSIGPFTLAARQIDMMLSAQESTHISAAQMNGAQMAFIETGYASGLDRNMANGVRQRLFDDGYTATKLALENIHGKN